MKSLAIALERVNGVPAQVANPPERLNLAANSPACVTVSRSLLRCTASLVVPAGQDTFSVVTYAQPGEIGLKLSTSTVTTVVSAGGNASCNKKGSGAISQFASAKGADR